MEQTTPTTSKLDSPRAIQFIHRKSKEIVRYHLTREDYVVLARALEHEGKPQVAVAWTLLQRFAYLYPLYKTLASFVRAYAQPINPLWFPDGANHIAWVAQLKAKNKLAEASDEIARAHRRKEYAAKSLHEISPHILEVIETVFASGVETPVPGSIHYRAPTIRTSDRAMAKAAQDEFARKRNYLSVYVGDPRRDNWLFADARSMLFRIELFTTKSSAVLLLLVLGGLAYYLMRGAHA